MKNVLLFGAGMMAGPVVEYLGRTGDIFTRVAAIDMHADTKKAVENNAKATFQSWNIKNTDAMSRLIMDADLVISLMPAWFHARVAGVCVEHGKNMVTASYVSPEMRSLDARAKQAGVLLLNEIGVDPGIDHMSAKKVIDSVAARGGRVSGFRSYTGGLPAPDANDNPWGYKLSWSPRSVVTAARNNARYLKDGQIVEIPAKDLFSDTHQLNFGEIGTLDAYPNRDSLPYIQLYGLDPDTMFRGTLRYPGWCRLWDAIVKLGMLDDGRPEAGTYADYTLGLTGRSGDVRKAVAAFLGTDEHDQVIEKLDYMGLMDRDPIRGAPEDRVQLLADLMAEKLMFRPGERDMLVMRHEFEIVESGKRYGIRSTMIEYGRPDGFSAMARTVGLPVAIGAKLILDGQIPLAGVHIPTLPVIYSQVLAALETEGIAFRDEIFDLR